MADQKDKPEAGAVFRLEKMYVKDLSFENPNAPEIYRQNQQPKADVNLRLGNRKVGEEHWEVTLSVHATLKADEKTIFIVEAEHAGLFLLRNIPDDHLPAVLGVECPTALFPFTRQIISQAVVDGGFVPFLLDPVNFLAMFRNSRKSNQEGASH